MAFRGSAAVATGLTTWTLLQGPGFLRLFSDTYIAAPDNGPPGLKLRSLAAYRYVGGKGVLSGYSAAEVLGASCGPRDAPVEVTGPHRGVAVDRLANVYRFSPDLLLHFSARYRGTRGNELVPYVLAHTKFEILRRPGLIVAQLTRVRDRAL